MKAYSILEDAVALIGTPLDEGIKRSGVGVINTVLLDLKLPTVCSLTDEISAESGVFTVIACGVAMLLAVYLGDDAALSSLNEVYSSARKGLLRGVVRVKSTAFGGDEA